MWATLRGHAARVTTNVIERWKLILVVVILFQIHVHVFIISPWVSRGVARPAVLEPIVIRNIKAQATVSTKIEQAAWSNSKSTLLEDIFTFPEKAYETFWRIIRKTKITNALSTLTRKIGRREVKVQIGSNRTTPNINLSAVKSMPQQTTSLPFCPFVSKGLVGKIRVDMTEYSFRDLEARFKQLEQGGHYKPPDCQSRHKVAVVIPYRNREKHLKIFLSNIHPFLQKQQLEYGIYVVDQAENTTFNRALLMNIGFTEALKQHDYDCFAFHDVDLLPEDDRNLYSCPQQPRHLSVAIDVFDYVLPYSSIFGGASQLSTEHFRLVNGFSNRFWGWGGEDDDMSSRVIYNGLHLTRYPASIARYKMILHTRDKGNPDNPKRKEMIKEGWKYYKEDGLGNLSGKYNKLGLDLKKLYTRVYVGVHEPTS